MTERQHRNLYRSLGWHHASVATVMDMASFGHRLLARVAGLACYSSEARSSQTSPRRSDQITCPLAGVRRVEVSR